LSADRVLRPAPRSESDRNTVIASYSRPGFWDYAEAYRVAGRALIADALLGRELKDELIYPILYVYRHALELALKYIIYRVEEDKTGVVQSEKLTLDAFLDQWLAAVKPSLRPATVASYSDNLRINLPPPGCLGRGSTTSGTPARATCWRLTSP
jgi:hypothetical protein